MSTRRLVILITFLSIFAMAMRVSVDSDSWWHFATGETILRDRVIPKVDNFSFTRLGEQWLYPSVSWIMETSMFLIFTNFSFGGLNFFTALMVTIAFAFTYRSLSGGVFLKAFVLILAAVTSGVYWSARPYMMTFVLTGLTIWLLEDFRWDRKDRLWVLPLIMVLWSNSHGGFAVGFILWGIYGLDFGVAWLGEARKENSLFPTKFTKDWWQSGMKGKVGRMLTIGGLMVITASINPVGPRILYYPFETISIGVLQDFIQEWQSPNFHSLQIQPFGLMIFLIIGLLGISQRKIVLSEFLTIFIFGSLGLIAGRNIALFALVTPPLITKYAAPIAEKLGSQLGYYGLRETKPPKFLNILNWTLFGILFLTVVYKSLIVTPDKINIEALEAQVPLGAIEYLRENQPPGNLLNSYNWGGYLIWELPQYPVFVDGRTDLYSDEIIGDWIDIVGAADGWQNKLDQYEIDLIFIEKSWKILPYLESNGWDLIYSDEISVIYQR